MKMKIRHSAMIVAAIIAILGLVTPVHAQAVSTRLNSPSYVPGDSGTLYLTIVNESPTETLEVRNMTIYYPWAGFVDNKWQGNETRNLSPFESLTTTGGGKSTYSAQFTFMVPSWFGGSFAKSCPGNSPRYGLYVACIMLGTNQNNLRYMDIDLPSIPIAAAVYTPPSLVAYALPVITIVVLVLATAFLALNWMAIKGLQSKK